MHKPIITLLSLIFFLIISIPVRVNGQRGRLVGARTEIKDVKTNKEVQELGRFAVCEYNFKTLLQMANKPNGPLVFLEVVKAQKQVVAGLKYYLKVEAMHKDDGLSMIFDAEVVVKPWANSKKLLNFGPSLSS